MKYYVGSSVFNAARVNEAAAVLDARGFTRVYDWTRHGDVSGADDAAKRLVAQTEAAAVMEAELVVLLLPGRFGTHAELGCAIASCANKRILLWSEEAAPFTGEGAFCVFYHHPAVERLVCPFPALLDHLQALS